MLKSEQILFLEILCKIVSCHTIFRPPYLFFNPFSLRQTGSDAYVLQVTPQSQTRNVIVNFPSRYVGDKLTSYSLPMALSISTPFHSSQSAPITAVIEIVGMYSPFRSTTLESHNLELTREMTTIEVSVNTYHYSLVQILCKNCTIVHFVKIEKAIAHSHVCFLLCFSQMFLTGQNFNEKYIYFTREASSDTIHRVLSRIVTMKLIITMPMV